MTRAYLMACGAISAVLLFAPAAAAQAATSEDGIGIAVEITPLPSPPPAPGPPSAPGPPVEPDPDAGPKGLTPTGGNVPWMLIALGAGAAGGGILVLHAQRRAASVPSEDPS